MSQAGRFLMTGGGGGTPITTLTGDIGGPVSPDGGGNIDILGGNDITVTGNPGTNTLTIDFNGTAADTFNADVGSAVPVLGVITFAGGNNIGTSAAGSTVTINLDGTTNHAVQVGNATASLTSLGLGLAGQVLTSNGVGLDPSFQAIPASGVTSITGNTGPAQTGAITLTGGTTGASFGGAAGTITMTFAGITANNGAVNLGTDNAGNAITIGTGTVARNINIGLSAAAHVINIGTNSGASSLGLNAGTGDMRLISGDEITLDASGILELNSTGGAISLGNDANAQAINIGTGAAARTITIGNSTGATSVVVDVGTGALNLGTTATAHATTLGSTNTTSATTVQSGSGALNITSTNGALTINSGTGVLGISTDSAATTVNIATGGAVKTTTLGSTNTTSTTTIQSGSGALNVTSTNGALTINSGTGTLGISTDASATTVNVATGGAVKTATFGSTNTTSATAIRSGTGSVIINTGLQADSTGRMTNPNQPCFQARLGADRTSVTGNSVIYTVVWDSEAYDRNNNFDGVSTFTAPVTGIYCFTVTVLLSNITITNTYGAVQIVTTSATYQLNIMNVGKVFFSNEVSVAGTIQTNMTAGDTAIVQVQVVGGTQTVNIQGNTGAAGNIVNHFSGFLIA